MEEAFELNNYLPVSLKTPSEQEYISFLREAFETNYMGGKYQFAFLASHMLMMSFIYFKIWQVRENCSEDFEKGLIGFARDDDRKWLRDPSPFTFSKVNERGVTRLFKLIGCDEVQVRNYRKLVDDRNDAAHANGNMFFSTRREIDEQICTVLDSVEEIQTHSHPIVQHCYRTFLLDSRNPEEREYLAAEDQIREALVRANYLSQKDIEFCINIDITDLKHEESNEVEALHRALCEAYSTE